MLLNKKPVPASKQTVADIVDASTKDLELGIMVMGGAPDPPQQDARPTAVKARGSEAAGPGSENAAVEAETGANPAEEAREANVGMTGSAQPAEQQTESQPVQPGEYSGDAVLQSAEFWTDLEGFLAQRIRSQEDATRLRGVFESAWRSTSAVP